CWLVFFFSSRRLHTMSKRDWSSDVCSSDLFGDDIQGFFPKSFDDFFGSGRSDIGQYPAGQITQEPGGILRQACLTGFCAELFTVAGMIDHVTVSRDMHTVVNAAYISGHHNVLVTVVDFKHR